MDEITFYWEYFKDKFTFQKFEKINCDKKRE